MIMMKKLLLVFVLLLVLPHGVTRAQQADNYPPDNTAVTIDSTNLPIVWIEVDGAMILRDERITARMKIIYNGEGQLNYADTVAHPGQCIDYDGYIGLRYRGNSSFTKSARKPYSFRTLEVPLEEGGKKQKVPLLGMPKDNNWALLAPYSDQSMARDLLSRALARPWMEYTPDGRYCELYLDGIYYGVYILTEVVSDGKHRLNLDEPGDSGDDLTGGYLMEVDRNESPVLFSSFHPENNAGKPYLNRNIYYQYGSPDYEDMTEDQLNYIKIALWRMETALASEDYQNPETGYAKYIDVMSFVDFQLAQELGHNVDAYRLSTKLFKRRDSEDPRFKLALWDMDQAYGGSTKYESWSAESWSYRMNDMAYEANDKYLVPFWWNRLNSDSAYTALVKQRWGQYRRSNVSLDNVLAVIDSLANTLTSHGAMDRNSTAWPRWGTHLWPNIHVPQNYADAIDYLKQWVVERIAWMDEQLGYDPQAPQCGDVNCDGQVTLADLTRLMNYLLTEGETLDGVQIPSADCDMNGCVDLGDVTSLIVYLLSGVWPE